MYREHTYMNEKRFYFAIQHILVDNPSGLLSKYTLSINSDCFRDMREHEFKFIDSKMDCLKIFFPVHCTNKHLKILSLSDNLFQIANNSSTSIDNTSFLLKWHKRLKKIFSQKIDKALFILAADPQPNNAIVYQDNYLVDHDVQLVLWSNPYNSNFQCYVKINGKFQILAAFDETNINPIFGSQVHFHTYSSKSYRKSASRKLWAIITSEGNWPDSSEDIPAAIPLLNPYAQLRRMHYIMMVFIVLLISAPVYRWIVTELNIESIVPQIEQLKKKWDIFDERNIPINHQDQIDCRIIQSVISVAVTGICDFETIEKFDAYLKNKAPDYRPIKYEILKRQRAILEYWGENNATYKDWRDWEKLGFRYLLSDGDSLNVSNFVRLMLKNKWLQPDIYYWIIAYYDYSHPSDNTENWHSLPGWQVKEHFGLKLTFNGKELKTKDGYYCFIVKQIIKTKHKNTKCESLSDEIKNYCINNNITVSAFNDTNLMLTDVISHWDKHTSDFTNLPWQLSPTLAKLKNMGFSIKGAIGDSGLKCLMVRALIKSTASGNCDVKDEAEIEDYINSIQDNFLEFLKSKNQLRSLWNPTPDIEKLNKMRIRIMMGGNELTTQTQVECFSVRLITDDSRQSKANCSPNIQLIEEYLAKNNKSDKKLTEQWLHSRRQILQDWEQQRKEARKNVLVEDLRSIGLNLNPKLQTN
jgi:hypothetical protein